MARIQYRVIVRQADGMERHIMVRADVGLSDPPFTEEAAKKVVMLGQQHKNVLRDPNDPAQPLRNEKGEITTGNAFLAEGEIIKVERINPTEEPQAIKEFKTKLKESEDDPHKRTGAKTGAK